MQQTEQTWLRWLLFYIVDSHRASLLSHERGMPRLYDALTIGAIVKAGYWHGLQRRSPADLC